MDIKLIKKILESATSNLFISQPNIFNFTSETGQTEWNLAHHYANEIHKLLPKYDCDLDVVKVNLDNKRPDIIFHSRGNNKSNFLIIELKRNKDKVKDDINKIQSYWFDKSLHYQFGAVVYIKDNKIRWIEVFKNNKDVNIINDQDIRKFIEEHLFNDLRWLLCAAVEWNSHKEITEKQPERDSEFPRHLRVFTMDSAMLHSRKFFEFFTEKETKNHISVKSFGLKEPLISKVYNEKLKCSLHEYLIHLQKERLNNKNQSLEKQVLKFAKEIIRLWDELSNKPEMVNYKELLKKVKQKALDDAEDTAKKYKLKSPFQ